MKRYTSLEVCAGAGGQALGLEQSGFDHLAMVEIDKQACDTLRHNRPHWNVIEGDLRAFSACSYKGVDLFSGGVPCPPFSIAGRQLGEGDERDLFPEMLRLTQECEPKAVLIENVKGLLSKRFALYRKRIDDSFGKLGYKGDWKLLYAADFGVPQLRPRVAFVAFKDDYFNYFHWPAPIDKAPNTVGDTLFDLISSSGWKGAQAWRENANGIAPTLVGGSKLHGGPDLGPTRARSAWAELGVDGRGLGNEPPGKDFEGTPRLTVEMTALIQGFPSNWHFTGRKTAAYRQVGNAFPPPVAKALGECIKAAIKREKINVCHQKRAKVLEINFAPTF